MISGCGSGAPDFNGSGNSESIGAPSATSAELDGLAIGGEVVGYAGGELVLKNGNVGEIKITKNGGYAFPSRVKLGDAYDVSIAKQPVAQTCQLINGQGVASKDIVDIQISCETSPFYKPTPQFMAPLTSVTDGLQLAFWGLRDNCNKAITSLNEANAGIAVYNQNYDSATQSDVCGDVANKTNMKTNWKITVNSKNNEVVDFTKENVNYRPESADAVTAQVKASVNKVIADPNLNQSVASWYIMPEVLRPWRNATRGTVENGNEMLFVELVRNAIRAAETQAGVASRPITGYQPRYREKSDLESFIGYFDIFVNGVYSYAPTDPSRAQKIYDGAKLNNLASGNATKYAPISSFDVSAELPADLSDADLKKIVTNNVYAAVVGGAKGFWVSLWNAVTETSRLKLISMYADVFKTINVDEPDLGRAFTKGEMARADALTPSVTSGNASKLFVQNYFHDGKKYVVAVNGTNNEVIVGALQGWPVGSVVRELDPNSGSNFMSPSTPSNLQFEIEPNGVRVWRISIE